MKEIIKITLAIDAMVSCAKRVLKAIEERGPVILPQLLESDAQRLKDAIKRLEELLGGAGEGGANDAA